MLNLPNRKRGAKMDNKNDVQKQFGRAANSYVTSDIHKKGKDLEVMLGLTNITGNETVLDIATGGGHTANLFAPHVKKLVALDLTPEMLQAAKAFVNGSGNDNVEFIQGDAENLPFDNEKLDIVTCRIAPHHFPHVKQFIEETYRVLKVGGQFILDDNISPENDEQDHFYNFVEKKRDYSHFRAWKKTEWICMLEQNGFLLRDLHCFEKSFKFNPWCDRMNLSSVEKSELSNYMLKAKSNIKKKFSIETINQEIISFKAEAMILKAVKA